MVHTIQAINQSINQRATGLGYERQRHARSVRMMGTEALRGPSPTEEIAATVISPYMLLASRPVTTQPLCFTGSAAHHTEVYSGGCGTVCAFAFALRLSTISFE